MRMRNFTGLLVVLCILLMPYSAWGKLINVQKTGQSTCWDEEGKAEGCDGTGQDGDVQAGVEWPATRFKTPPGSGCVQDMLTGLTWTADSVLMTYPAVGDHLSDTLNKDSGLCGHTDWRVPTIVELMTLMNLGAQDRSTYLNAHGFNVSPGQYVSSSGTHVLLALWTARLDSSTQLLYSAGSADVANWLFVRGGAFGKPNPDYPANTWNEYPGNGGPGVDWPSPRFVDNGDKTLTDKLTGLMWAKEATANVEACNETLSPALLWKDALEYIQCLNQGSYLGHNDWRMPNVMEFLSTVNWDNGQSIFRNVAVLPSNPNEYSNSFWTSDSGLSNPEYAVISEASGPNAGPGRVEWKCNTRFITGTWPVRGEPGYNIRGTVTENGAPLAGVTVMLSGPASMTTQTGPDGKFWFIGLGRGSYTIKPELDECTFSPSSRTVQMDGANITGRDFAATRKTYSLTGSVKDSEGKGIPQVTMTLGGALNKTATTSTTGYYKFTGLPSGSYTLTPGKNYWFFTPEERTVDISGAGVSGQNFTGEYGGSLLVNISPSGAVGADARWRVDAGVWQTGGTTLKGLRAGVHEVSFKDVPGWSPPAAKQVTIESGKGKKITGTYVPDGSLKVTISLGARNAGAQWQVDGGAWKESGATVTNLSVGPHTVTFKDVAGWSPPDPKTVEIESGATTSISGMYTKDGSLKVTINSGARDAGARWKVDGGDWHSSGVTVKNLSPGAHAVAFKNVAGWTPPADKSVTIEGGETANVSGVYVKDGALKVTLTPQNVVTSGARWKIDDQSWQKSGTTLKNVSAGTHAISFKDVPGWTTPVTRNVTVESDKTATKSYLYKAQPLSNTPNADIWKPNGDVLAIATSGSITYIGGVFNHIGPDTGNGVPLDTETGAPKPGYLKVNGEIRTAVPDSAGGWYLGGAFTQVGGITRNYIAHILPDGTLDPSWDPNAGGAVNVIALSGDKVCAGGSFTTIGGETRNHLAALDSAGKATSWDPNADGEVIALAVDGETIYAGGTFTNVGGWPRSNIAGLDVDTGGATSWDPYASGTVHTLVVNGGIVYAGGGFSSIGGAQRRGIAALDMYGNATSWDPAGNLYATVKALVLNGETIYVGGDFTSMGGEERNNIAALDIATGNATSWNPNADDIYARVNALAVSGGTVYAGGFFPTIGGEIRKNIAAIDISTGKATSWNPIASSEVKAVAVSGTTVYAGSIGWFGGVARNNIAAIGADGKPTSWNPDANSYVYALAVDGSTVYAGGNFTTIGGEPRNRIAALNTAGKATSWDPNANERIYALAVDGTTLYAGGYFTNIGGQERNRIAALDMETALASSWNPNADAGIKALAVSGGTVYAGGYFTNIGGQARMRIAALDATGSATSWNPITTYIYDIRALAVKGETVFAGGRFTGYVGGQYRTYLAAFDAATGNATSWNPAPNNVIGALALSGDTLYAAGWFTSIGGQARTAVAGLSTGTGEATSWNQTSAQIIITLAVTPDRVWGWGIPGLVRFDGQTDPQ
ncbi:MAG: DUF1566 domain-containing protein [Syntrophobacteraceae bacterium]